mgnify:CR=1 FL=1
MPRTSRFAARPGVAVVPINQPDKECIMKGKKNLAAGFLFLTAFMVYGFVLIYWRDFAPGKEAWIALKVSGSSRVSSTSAW